MVSCSPVCSNLSCVFRFSMGMSAFLYICKTINLHTRINVKQSTQVHQYHGLTELLKFGDGFWFYGDFPDFQGPLLGHFTC